jgi:hypothetical protein
MALATPTSTPPPEPRVRADLLVMNAEHQQRRCDHLGEHLGLTEIARFDRDAAGGGDTAKARDSELAANDEDRHPAGDHMDLYKRNERAGDEEFIGDGIEKSANGCGLLPAPGEVPVEKIGCSGEEKDSESDLFVGNGPPGNLNIAAIGNQSGYEQRHHEDPH